VLEKLPLISSWIRTLFDLHLVKSANFLFDSSKNLDLLVLESKSLTKSKLLIASTRCASFNSRMFNTSSVIVSFVFTVVPIPTFTCDSIEVSAKFFNPAGWTNLFTGFTNFSHSTVLLTVYDKFW